MHMRSICTCALYKYTPIQIYILVFHILCLIKGNKNKYFESSVIILSKY